MAWNDSDITPAVLLQHMQGMKYELKQDIHGLAKRMDRFEERMDQLEHKVDRGFAHLTVRIGNIDERLDEIEVGELPRIRKKLKMRRKSQYTVDR
mgnify:CR=1 FL=1